MKNCIGVPKTDPQGEKNGFFGVNFEDLLLNIFEKSFFFHFFFTNVHLIPGFRGHRSSLTTWRILGWTPYRREDCRCRNQHGWMNVDVDRAGHGVDCLIVIL